MEFKPPLRHKAYASLPKNPLNFESIKLLWSLYNCSKYSHDKRHLYQIPWSMSHRMSVVNGKKATNNTPVKKYDVFAVLLILLTFITSFYDY